MTVPYFSISVAEVRLSTKSIYGTIASAFSNDLARPISPFLIYCTISYSNVISVTFVILLDSFFDLR